MKAIPTVWTRIGDPIKNPIHYKGCGLDNIWLSSGYHVEEVHGEKCIRISDLDGLHAAIGRSLAKRKKILNGKEIRFLRQQMDLTQSELARLIGCDSQQIARYEKAENKMPGPADRLLRMLAREHFNDSISVRAVLEAVDQMDSKMDERQVFQETADGWKSAA